MNKKRRRHFLVIGGTRGIGRALVSALSKKGYTVSVVGKKHPTSKGRRLADTHYFLVDLTDTRKLYAALEEIILRNGKINSLIFLQRYRGNDDAWEGEFRTSLTATRNIIEYLADKFDEGKDKSIVLLSSVASRFVAEEQPLSYHIAKAGLNQLVRYYAVILGRRGIRINSVSPCTVLKEESKDFYLNNKGLYNLYKKIIPLGRMGTAEEVVDVILFLSSSSSSFITGEDITVDGGVSLRFQEALARQLKRQR